MLAWDQPAEVLLETGPQIGARLMMPRLGEPLEPAHIERVEAWWRTVDVIAPPLSEAAVATTMPKAVPWPLD